MTPALSGGAGDGRAGSRPWARGEPSRRSSTVRKHCQSDTPRWVRDQKGVVLWQSCTRGPRTSTVTSTTTPVSSQIPSGFSRRRWLVHAAPAVAKVWFGRLTPRGGLIQVRWEIFEVALRRDRPMRMQARQGNGRFAGRPLTRPQGQQARYVSIGSDRVGLGLCIPEVPP